MIPEKLIGIAGAGSIGCFVGGMLSAAGRPVALLARPRIIEEIKDNGLRLTSFEGLERRIAPDRLTLSEDPSIFAGPGVVLVTVKSADSAEMARSATIDPSCGAASTPSTNSSPTAETAAITAAP